MPKRKDQLICKQKRLIATRLMQISLLVDDYLYQQKPMSTNSAAAYIREISEYKNKCYRDVRSLQVIEKLTRCMKGIISEQEELQNELEADYELGFHFQDVSKNTNEMSPVYSTVDEDLTQCLEDDNTILDVQIHDQGNDSTKEVDKELNRIETQIDMNAKITGHDNDGQPTEKYPLFSDIEVIDLCDDVINELTSISPSNDIRFQHEPEFNIQNAISSLSIRDFEEAFTPFYQECSQSILDNYCPESTANFTQKDVVPLTMNHDVRTAINRPETEIVSKDILKIVLPITNKKANIQTPVNIPAVKNIKKNTRRKAINNTESVKAAKTKIKNVNAKNKNNINTSKQKIDSKMFENNTISANDTKQAQKDIKANDSNSAQKPKQQSQACNHIKKLTYKTQLCTETLESHINKETFPIYNKTVVNDLSWIENIRFVREIPSEEYETFTESEVFWENYSLPDHWNEDDFNY